MPHPLGSDSIARRASKFIVLPFIVNGSTAARIYGALFSSIPSLLHKHSLEAFRNRIRRGTVTFRVLGQEITLPGKEFFGYAQEVYVDQCYFPSEAFCITSNMTVVDLGANVGIFSILAAKLGKRVIAVEMEPHFFAELQENISRNRVQNIEAVRGAVGHRLGETIKTGDAAAPRLEMNELLETRRVDKIDFLKVDIEGSEFDLFTRDNEWLSRVDRVAAEIHPSYGDPGELAAILERYGFLVTLANLTPGRDASVPGYLFARRKS